MIEVAVILIRNSSGEYFVHRRAGDRKVFPGLYGLGAGGKLDAGESPDAAAARELFEETGLNNIPLRRLFAFTFDEPPHSHHVHVFEARTDRTPLPDAREWQWSGWMPESEVSRIAVDGRLCPDTAILFDRYRSLEAEECRRDNSVPDELR